MTLENHALFKDKMHVLFDRLVATEAVKIKFDEFIDELLKFLKPLPPQPEVVETKKTGSTANKSKSASITVADVTVKQDKEAKEPKKQQPKSKEDKVKADEAKETEVASVVPPQEEAPTRRSRHAKQVAQ